MAEDTLVDPKKTVHDYIRAMLGGGMVDIELDPIHYEIATQKAIDKYRQLSSNAVEESYGFLDLKIEQNTYIMDPNIITIRQIFRRSFGGSVASQGTTTFDPFELAYSNLYLLQAGRIGGIATYDMFAGYVEQLGKMFGGYINFTFDPNSHKLVINRKITADENVLLWMYNYKTDDRLLTDNYAKTWLKDYALAVAKMMIGEARSKFSTIAGPQGGTTLNGDALKSEAMAEMEKLEEDIKNYKDGGTPLFWLYG